MHSQEQCGLPRDASIYLNDIRRWQNVEARNAHYLFHTEEVALLTLLNKNNIFLLEIH